MKTNREKILVKQRMVRWTGKKKKNWRDGFNENDSVHGLIGF